MQISEENFLSNEERGQLQRGALRVLVLTPVGPYDIDIRVYKSGCSGDSTKVLAGRGWKLLVRDYDLKEDENVELWRTVNEEGEATPVGKLVDLGTPSAPPLVDIGADEDNSELATDTSGGLTGTEHSSKKGFSETPEEAWYGNGLGISEGLSRTQGIKLNILDVAEEACCGNFSETESEGGDKANVETNAVTYSQQGNSVEFPSRYDTSQNGWQVLLAYDACVRLCLNAWARGCVEAPEFLHDECQMLRSAFCLQKLLLQSRCA